MKFIFFACVLALVSQLAFAQSPESKLRTRCTYFADRLILNCTGPSGVVECETADEFPMKFKIVGISIPSDFQSQDAKLRRFNLNPLRSDNLAWLNSRVMLNGKAVQFSLYQSGFIRDAGFRLRDSRCFERLVGLLSSSKANLVVPSTNEVSADIRNERSKSKIELVGEIFWFNGLTAQRSQVVKSSSRVKKATMNQGRGSQIKSALIKSNSTSGKLVQPKNLKVAKRSSAYAPQEEAPQQSYHQQSYQQPPPPPEEEAPQQSYHQQSYQQPPPPPEEEAPQQSYHQQSYQQPPQEEAPQQSY